MPETRFFEQHDGSKIAYQIFKSENAKNEVPLVLIIGLGGTKEHFFGFEEVIVFDNRGIGESTVVSSADPITLDLMAQDTIELIKHLGIKRFNLLGEAMSGRIALCIALKLQSDLKLEKLIVCSCASHLDTSTKVFQEVEQFYKLPSFNLPINIQEQKDNLLKSDRDKNLAKYLLEHPDKLDKISEILWEANKNYDLTPRLKEIKVPTLIIHGEANETVPIQNAELLNRDIPNSQLHRVPNVGHGIFVMVPETANVISEFLNN
ncbi:7720_t:CDS:2 [Dentiscutata erythropus]|uniref:7720_t:CDS:1 n=1 Tax=Dentiscutata erythropus TaxID=1348616 RepID=A0A9N8WS55_9GLOM|nr:7720_t:CDS:2 [Dentiscutata erythropus]